MYVENEQEWEVGGIFRHKGSGKRRKNLVAYSLYNESKVCWLPESKLCNALGILNDYIVSHGLT